MFTEIDCSTTPQPKSQIYTIKIYNIPLLCFSNKSWETTHPKRPRNSLSYSLTYLVKPSIDRYQYNQIYRILF